jgi:hypothetical protein
MGQKNVCDLRWLQTQGGYSFKQLRDRRAGPALYQRRTSPMGDQIDCDGSRSAAEIEIECVDWCAGLAVIWHIDFLSSEIPATILTAILKNGRLIEAGGVTLQKWWEACTAIC